MIKHLSNYNFSELAKMNRNVRSITLDPLGHPMQLSAVSCSVGGPGCCHQTQSPVEYSCRVLSSCSPICRIAEVGQGPATKFFGNPQELFPPDQFL